MKRGYILHVLSANVYLVRGIEVEANSKTHFMTFTYYFLIDKLQSTNVVVNIFPSKSRANVYSDFVPGTRCNVLINVH